MADRIGVLRRSGLVDPPSALQAVIDDAGLSQGDVAIRRLVGSLASFLDGLEVADIRLVSAAHVGVWVAAPLSDGRLPSVATRHNRRTAARVAFRLLREAGVVDIDPTVDLALPSRDPGREARPLTDREIRAGRAAAMDRVNDTLRPVVWALAEATATTHEIPRITPTHIDLETGVVALPGSAKTDPRSGELSDWGVGAIGRRLAAEPGHGHIAYTGEGRSEASMQAAASGTLGRILTRAGLRDDPAVLPASVRAWAGHRVWEQTGRIEAAAVALGVRTLDSAAAIIDLDWRPR